MFVLNCIFRSILLCLFNSVSGRDFVDVARATPCAEPSIVLAASPGLGAETTMPLDVKPKRAADRRARSHDYYSCSRPSPKSRSHPLRVKCVTERRRNSSGLELAYFTACTLGKKEKKTADNGLRCKKKKKKERKEKKKKEKKRQTAQLFINKKLYDVCYL